MTVAPAIDLLLAASVTVGVPLTVRAVRAVPAPLRPAAPGRWATPGRWLGLVIAAVLANQVLFTVYVLRVHHGDPSFIARYLPAGWFDLADGPAMRGLAARFPAPELLAPAVLRVQALLELPFVLLAYLCVAGWLRPRFAAALLRPSVLWAACVSYSVVFGLVEWSLTNPYTTQDLVLRGVSCVVTPVLLARLAVSADAPRTAGQLLAAVASAAALGVVVLLVYDVALLYNLGHFTTLLPVAAGALVVLVPARLLARRTARAAGPAGAGTDTVLTCLAWFAALFFVPALAIRYAMDLATMWLTAVAAAAVAVVALVLALREVSARLARQPGAPSTARWLAQLAVAAVAGVVAAGAATLPPPTYPEARILLAAALFLTAVTGVCAGTDALLARAGARLP